MNNILLINFCIENCRRSNHSTDIFKSRCAKINVWIPGVFQVLISSLVYIMDRNCALIKCRVGVLLDSYSIE